MMTISGCWRIAAPPSRTTAAIGTLLAPVLAPVLSVLGAGVFLSEPLGWREALALGGTVAAVALAVGVRDKPA